MASFDIIAAFIAGKKQEADGTLILSATDLDLVYFTALYKRSLRCDKLIVHEPEVVIEDNSVTIKGKTSIWQQPLLAFTLVFTKNEHGLVIATTQVTVPPGKKAQLPVLSWLFADKAKTYSVFIENNFIDDFGYTFELRHLNSTDGIPVRMHRDMANCWQIDFIGEEQLPMSVEKVLNVLGTESFTGILPDSLIKLLNNLFITGVHGTINIKEKYVQLFQIGLSFKCDWTILPGICVGPKIEMAISVTGTGTAKTETSVTILAGFKLGGIPVPLILVMNTDNSAWFFGIEPGKKISLPDMKGLISLGGQSSILNLFPEGLINLPGINVNELLVAFNPHKPELSNISFSVDTASPWKIIPDYFEVTHLDVRFNIENPLNTETRKISGDVYCAFAIEQVFLMMQIRKDENNPDWKITGGLDRGKSINLTKITSQLFKGKNYVSGDVPDFSFSQLEITVVPAKKSFAFKAESDQAWKFNENVSITKFGLEFNRDPENKLNPIKGHVSGSIAVGNTDPVTITLSAAIGETTEGGLQLEGSTDKALIPIGHLAEYVAKAFDAEAKIPEWFSGIKLSEIGVGYHTKSGNFHFEVTGKIPVADSPVVVKVRFTLLNNGHGKFTRHLSGKLLIGDNTEFTLDIENSPSGTLISGTWEAKTSAGYLRFEELARKLGFTDLPAIPDALDLTLIGATFLYDSKESLFVITCRSEHYGQAVFVTEKLKNKIRFYGFCINIKLDIKLADVPLVGNKIPDAENICIKDGNVWILSCDLSAGDVVQLNTDINNPVVPKLPAGPLAARVLLHAGLQLGQNNVKMLDLALIKEKKKKLSLTEPDNENDSPSPTWIDIQKQFGIFQFKRIGFAYHQNMLSFLLDAGMAMGPLSFSFDGLSITSPLSSFKPKFDLSGLGLAYKQGTLDIEGALLKLPSEQLDAQTKFQFDGLAIIKAGNFSLSAIGSYSQLESGDPSFFLFAQVEATIGGPPPFFITGVMAGMGFNRSLAIPTMDEVQNFPLLMLAQPKNPGEKIPVQDPMHMLNVLSGREAAIEGGTKRAWIKAAPGQYWLAVGLQFTSFKVVKSRALLIAEFGHDLSFALLGLSTLQLPQSSEGKLPYVFAELQLKAVLLPQEGFFGLSAILSANSFVLTQECHITGGFALYSWFGLHKFSGQFVLSMGGYHPAFEKPPHYPDLPRLGFNWAVSSTTSIKGNAYFALTPSCVMAGGGLEILFYDGIVKAWFTAHADFLIAWRPFFYTASIGVSVGVEINPGSDDCHSGNSHSVSADVEMWGPPTGGKVHVHLVFVTFTVHFGSENAGTNNKEIPWHEFSELLPLPSENCHITASDGIYKTAESEKSSSGKAWVVRAGKFSFITESAIPSSHFTYGDGTKKVKNKKSAATKKEIDIRPMNKTGVSSEHFLGIFKNGEYVQDITAWKLNPRYAIVPESLWGKPSSPFSQTPSSFGEKNSEKQLVGYEIVAPVPILGSGPGPIKAKTISLDYLSPEGKAPLSPDEKKTKNYLPAFSSSSLTEIQAIGNADAVSARKTLCASLAELNLYNGADQSMKRLAEECTHLYDSTPMLL